VLAVERDVAQQVTAALVVHYGFITIDVPGATNTYAYGINNLGQIVGVDNTPGEWDHGFIYDGKTFTTLNYPGTTASADRYYGGTSAQSLNDSGLIVGGRGRTYLGVPYGFKYSAGTFAAMPSQPCALATVARGVSNSSRIVGASELRESSCYPNPTPDANPVVGYLYSEAGFTALAPPSSVGSMALGINNHGLVVGSYSDSARIVHGFLYYAGHYTTIDAPGSSLTVAHGVNDSRQIVGTCTLSDGRQHGFLLSADTFTFTTIDVPGATATLVMGINNSGWIVGSYADSTGAWHGFEKIR